MNWNIWTRTVHRWTSMLFILVVAAIFAMQAMGHEPATWIYLVPLLPLAVLALTGLYLFVLPYAQKARAGG